MKIYKDKDNNLTIVYGPNESPGGVTLVDDRGTNAKSFFGMDIPRYRYHCTSINAGHSSSTNKLKHILNSSDKRYKLIRSKQK